jgi:MSHA biogenesis protein MshN
MSVINQVLNQLEQRGAHTAAEQPMVRAVARNRSNFVIPLLATGLVLIAAFAAWQLGPSHKPVLSSAEGPAVMAESVAPKAANSPGSHEPEKSMPQLQAAAAAVVPASGAPAGNTLAGQLAPASRLSFELSSAPLPSSLREDSGQATSTRPLVLSEVEGSGQATSTGSGQALRSGNSKPAANSVTAARRRTGATAPTVRPHTKPAATANAKVAAQSSTGAVPMKQVSSAQQADAEFRRAAGLMQLGRIAEAMAGYEAALRLDAGHEAARQALVALLLEGKRNADAEKVLLEGLNSKPEHTGLTMLLARLQVERGALGQATATLEKSLPFADTQADYRAFLAALLQRQNRNEEAIAHYQIVLQHAPGNGVWLMGYGISLQAVQRNAEAKDAYKRALDTQTLSPELQAFVQQKLKGL